MHVVSWHGALLESVCLMLHKCVPSISLMCLAAHTLRSLPVLLARTRDPCFTALSVLDCRVVQGGGVAAQQVQELVVAASGFHQLSATDKGGALHAVLVKNITVDRSNFTSCMVCLTAPPGCM